MIAAGEQPQALRGLIEQFGLGQDAPPDRDHGAGGEDIGAGEFLVLANELERGLRLGVTR